MRFPSLVWTTALLCIIGLPVATATVTIIEVLPNPIATQSGGEAVLLQNMDDSTIDISGWNLLTGTSTADVKLPANTTLCGKCTFLIADVGWSTKRDNVTWPLADYEETMTLVNLDSGVALFTAAGVRESAIMWGNPDFIPEELQTTSHALTTAPGMSIRRTSLADEELLIADPWWGPLPEPVTTISAPLEITPVAPPIVTISDEDTSSGIQWKSSTPKEITITGTGEFPTVFSVLLGSTLLNISPVATTEGWEAVALISPPQPLTPGNTTLLIQWNSEGDMLKQTIEIPAHRLIIAILDKKIQKQFNTTFMIHVENKGSTALSLGVTAGYYRNATTPFRWRCGTSMNNLHSADLIRPMRLGELIPGNTLDLMCVAVSTRRSVTGTYRGNITFVELR